MLGQNLLKLLPELELSSMKALKKTTGRANWSSFWMTRKKKPHPNPRSRGRLELPGACEQACCRKVKENSNKTNMARSNGWMWPSVKSTSKEHRVYSVVISDITDIKKSEGVLPRQRAPGEMVAAEPQRCNARARIFKSCCRTRHRGY